MHVYEYNLIQDRHIYFTMQNAESSFTFCFQVWISSKMNIHNILKVILNLWFMPWIFFFWSSKKKRFYNKLNAEVNIQIKQYSIMLYI